jgi:hypothetical protein
MSENAVSSSIPRLRAGSISIPTVTTVLLPLLLLAPALWNGYPLLQYDTGGYLARWYEGYLVPSRSTVFGLYLHLGEPWQFWTNLALQALATLWILQLILRIFGVATPFRLLAIALALIGGTALPWIASMLLTDIFAGLSVLTLFLLIAYRERTTRLEKVALFAFTAFAAATHSATLGVLFGLCCLAALLKPLLGARISWAGVGRGFAALAVSSAMLLGANFALSGKLAWTPGGVGVTFGRMLQDGIVARYLNDHCATIKLKLCPYRKELPPTADDFLWGKSMFNTLGRFEGMDEEMGFIAAHALTAYPGWQAQAALTATVQQLRHVATGEGTNGWIPHTYGIIERYLPGQVPAMRAARQQHWDINFPAINVVHVPVALGSMALLIAIVATAAWRRRLDDLTLLAATVVTALLGNAFICGVISGPHDRYGSRMVWLATFVVLIVAARWFAARERGQTQGRLARNDSTPSL